MEEFKLLNKMEKVEAPPGFEQKVMAQLSLSKRKRVKTRRLVYSFAGACATLAMVFMVVNFILLPQRGNESIADLEGGSIPVFRPGSQLSQIQTIPITEAVNYSSEIRGSAREPRTIYLLEQVSDRTDTKIIY